MYVVSILFARRSFALLRQADAAEVPGGGIVGVEREVGDLCPDLDGLGHESGSRSIRSADLRGLRNRDDEGDSSVRWVYARRRRRRDEALEHIWEPG